MDHQRGNFMKFKMKKIFPTLIVLIGLFGVYLISGQPLYLFFSFFGLSYIVIQIFPANGYDNKFFYISFSILILIQSIIIIYIYIFKTIYLQYPLFYPLFILAVIMLIYDVTCLIHYPKDLKIPIK
jgi:hypothetical protein